MLARDYSQLGTEKSILYRIGNGSGFPFKGPSTIRFIDAQTLAVIEKGKGVSFVKVAIDSTPKPKSSAGSNLTMLVGPATDLYDTNETDSISFLKIDAVDICKVTLSKNIAVCDTAISTVNFIDGKEWFQKKIMPGQFRGMTGLACFNVGFEVFFVICDSIDKTVSVTKEGGQVVVTSYGDPGNSFEQPISMSVYTGAADFSEAIPVPPWYVGSCSLEDLRNKLSADAEPGSFLVAKDINITAPKTFNVVYIDSIWSRELATIALSETGTYILASKDAALIQDSVWDIVRKWDMLIQPEYDPRKYALIAVADESTRCVQILKYYWWKNDLYVPALEYFCTIGGIYKGCGLRLTRPSSVSYCPGHSGGDLAICDAGARKVYIISHRMIPMRAIDTSFQPDWHIFDDAEVGKSIRPDIYPVSVAFSPDRLLCVAYRDGGLLVYKPYNIARVGKFLDFEANLFEHMLKFTDYSSIEVLRNSCRCFHNLTRDLRKAWRLPMMSEERYKDVLYQYVKWARTDSGLPFIGTVSPLKDKGLNDLCVKKLNKCCTNRFCTDSHEPLVIDLNIVYKKGESFLLYEHLQIAFTEVYGTPFLWKQGIFISKYFEHYSDLKRITIRHDPMTWKNETMRKEVTTELRVLTFWKYLHLFTMAEECFTRCKNFDEQPIFKVFARPSAAVPKGQMRSLNDSVLYEEVERPYLEKLGHIPPVKNKVPAMKALSGLGEIQQKETNISAGNAHVKYFDMQTDQAISLMNRLFS